MTAIPATYEDVAEQFAAVIAATGNGEIHLNPEYWCGQLQAALAAQPSEHRPPPTPVMPAAGTPVDELPSWFKQVLSQSADIAAVRKQLDALQATQTAPAAGESPPGRTGRP
jgi:hypothetical protein